MIRILILALLASPAMAADFEFCWIGANGFTLEGRMSVPDTALAQNLITEDDVTTFTITGRHDGLPIGGWSASKRATNTSWNLNFDPQSMTFATGGFSTSDQGQQWNASGSVNNCGVDGFGFNAGASGQDLCLHNTYRRDSTVARDTPISVFPLGEGPPCGSAPLLGSLLISTPQG